MGWDGIALDDLRQSSRPEGIPGGSGKELLFSESSPVEQRRGIFVIFCSGI